MGIKVSGEAYEHLAGDYSNETACFIFYVTQAFLLLLCSVMM